MCLGCRNKRYLWTEYDDNEVPLTSCLTEDECNNDPSYAPKWTEVDSELFYECSECLGFFDHSETEPVCTPCTLNFCERCKWDFYERRYECLDCNEGAVYDLTITDCTGSCGSIYKYST